MRKLYNKLEHFRIGIDKYNEGITKEEVNAQLKILLKSDNINEKYNVMNSINEKLKCDSNFPKEFILTNLDSTVSFLENIGSNITKILESDVVDIFEYSDFINKEESRKTFELFNDYSEKEECLSLIGNRICYGKSYVEVKPNGLSYCDSRGNNYDNFYNTKLYFLSKEDQMVVHQIKLMSLLARDGFSLFNDYCSSDKNKLYTACSYFIVEDYLYEDESDYYPSEFIYMDNNLFVFLYDNNVHVLFDEVHGILPYSFKGLSPRDLYEIVSVIRGVIFNGEVACAIS